MADKNNSVNVIDKRSLPSELTQLPIFQVIGNQIPTNLAKPETKKTISKNCFLGCFDRRNLVFLYHIATIDRLRQPDHLAYYHVHYHRGTGHAVS